MDSIEEPSDGDELRLMRVNDVDLKAVDVGGDDQYNQDDAQPEPEKKSSNTE